MAAIRFLVDLEVQDVDALHQSAEDLRLRHLERLLAAPSYGVGAPDRQEDLKMDRNGHKRWQLGRRATKNKVLQIFAGTLSNPVTLSNELNEKRVA